jgi:triphosphatase
MKTETPTGKEIEWQLDAQDLSVVLRWIETFVEGTDGITLTSGRTINQHDTYVDTADRRLDRAGYSVRLRRTRRSPAEATIKSLDDSAQDALRIRLEVAERLESDDPVAVAQAPGPVGRRVRALVGPRALVPLFDLHTRRRVFHLAVAGAPSGELLLDETTIRDPDGGILSRLRRVEVEVPESAVEVVRELVETLQDACGLQPALLTKYEAALVARGYRRVEQQTFGRTAITGHHTIGEVALAILRRQLATLLAKEPGTRLGDDIEELHDMRVASRRMRAAVALFGDFLPAEMTRLRADLAWVGQTIGAVRDLDVQLEQLDEWLALLPEADRGPLTRLRTFLQEQRSGARAEMLAALDSRRYESFVRRFGSVLRSRSGARSPAALAVAPDLVERRHRSLRKAKRKAVRSGDAATYHRLRITAKRFRYALEFLSEVYPGKTKALVKRTVALQDLLGAYQDADVATARLRELAAQRGVELGPEAVFAMGEVAERYRASMDEVLGGVPKAYAKLVGRAWKRLRKRMEAARPPEPPSPRVSAAPSQPPASPTDAGANQSTRDAARSSTSTSRA